VFGPAAGAVAPLPAGKPLCEISAGAIRPEVQRGDSGSASVRWSPQMRGERTPNAVRAERDRRIRRRDRRQCGV